MFPKELMRDGPCSLLSLKDGLQGNIATYAQYSPGRGCPWRDPAYVDVGSWGFLFPRGRGGCC